MSYAGPITESHWLRLRFDRALELRLQPEAEYIANKYKRLPSVYETSVSRILRGLIAEEVLAIERGAKRADVTRPWDFPYDVSPDLEIRAVLHPAKVEHWAGACIVAYEKDVREDRKRPRRNRWVLGLVDYGRMLVDYPGWATSAELLDRPGWPAQATSRGGKSYSIYGALYPDELRPMDELT